jgi:hypothetical protein
MRSPPHPITAMVSKGAMLSAIASWTAATAARTGICRKTNVPLPWDGADDASPDVVLRLGKVPPRLETPDHIAPIFQTRGRGFAGPARPHAGIEPENFPYCFTRR